ncbi:hypothetical protein [Vibrio nigripulchritudo]|uniref:hypothetical protein n=1 Tax=Vibrio nigripulchritudo TaxID=28173 RepID=UPI0024908252|nr:hypothetical protein [Vibrio nigripulchritudo]BDU42882.1 hypothetical protein TUMSATVNIG3_16800 [Vibrio nigripulchritudo]
MKSRKEFRRYTSLINAYISMGDVNSIVIETKWHSKKCGNALLVERINRLISANNLWKPSSREGFLTCKLQSNRLRELIEAQRKRNNAGLRKQLRDRIRKQDDAPSGADSSQGGVA